MAVRSVYRGALGATTKEHIHVTCPCGSIVSAIVYRSVDVSAHPDLGQRLRSDDPARALNTASCPASGTRDAGLQLIQIPVIYHDPEHEQFILVLPESERHRELAARAALLLKIDDDPEPVPAYVRDFQVVFGTRALDALLATQADAQIQQALDAERVDELKRGLERVEARELDVATQSSELELLRSELRHREQELARKEQEMTRRDSDLGLRLEALERRERELELDRQALDRRDSDSVRRMRELDQRANELEQAATSAQRDTAALVVSAPIGRDTIPVRAIDKPQADKTLVVPYTHVPPQEKPKLFEPSDAQKPARTHPLKSQRSEVSQVTELDASEAVELIEGEVIVTDVPVPAGEPREAVVSAWMESGESGLAYVDANGSPRLCMCPSAVQRKMLLGSRLDLRVQLHCLESYPVLVIAIGAPESLSGVRGASPPVALVLDIEDERHRRVIKLLIRTFTLHLDVFDATYVLARRRLLTASLEGNVRYVAERARKHLDGIAVHQRSMAKARAVWADPEFDRFGVHHPEKSEFREDKLGDLSSAQTVRRALSIAERFSKSEREEYLFLLRGYPVGLWQEKRRDVLARAISLGIWMGKRLAPIAVEEGFAHSHADLIARLQSNFNALQNGALENDLDPDAASDNWTALQAEASEHSSHVAEDAEAADQHTVSRRRPPRQTPIMSSAEQAVSGTIGSNPRVANLVHSAQNLSLDELMAGLQDENTRADAAVELARRREISAIQPIMSAVASMTRRDAVGVLSAMPSFGDTATASLIDGLASHKGFVRQGCALALAVLRNESALEALSDHVISEPTAMWREIARGIGTIGSSAIMPMVSRLSKNDEGARERVAWALAHIAARGGSRQVEQLARGREPLAASVARHALELSTHAQRDDLQVRGKHTPKEQTVNRAFSRRFFQALEASTPVVGVVSTVDLRADVSSPSMILDEADLLEATEYDDDGEEMLDESDLIPT